MISGIFDIISCVMYFQHSKYKPFEKDMPKLVLLAQIMFIASPIVLFISSFLSYSIFSDCQSQLEEMMPVNGRGYGGPPQQRQYEGPGGNSRQSRLVGGGPGDRP